MLGVLLLVAVVLLAGEFLLTVDGLGQLNAASLGRIRYFSMGDFHLVAWLAVLQVIVLLVAVAVAGTSPDRAVGRSKAVVIITVVLVGLDIVALAIRPAAVSPVPFFYSLGIAGELRDVEIVEFVVSLIAVMLVLWPRRLRLAGARQGTPGVLR